MLSLFSPTLTWESWRRSWLRRWGHLADREAMAKCSYRSPALGLFPASLGCETHALSAGQGSLQSCCTGLSCTVLPALKAVCALMASPSRWFPLPSTWSWNEMDSWWNRLENSTFNYELAKGAFRRIWYPVSSGIGVRRQEGKRYVNLLLSGLKLVTSQESDVHFGNLRKMKAAFMLQWSRRAERTWLGM